MLTSRENLTSEDQQPLSVGDEVVLLHGTTEGAIKGWETRREGGGPSEDERVGRVEGPEREQRIGRIRDSREDTHLFGPGDALQSLLNREKVNIAPEDVRAFLEKAGEQDEDPDITDMQVEGQLIFGGNGLGIKRDDMPQVPKEHRDNFLKELKEQGVRVVRREVSPLDLSPSQREISARIVSEKIKKYEKDPKRKFPPLLVGKDGRVLDGHHHWGMMAAIALDNPDIKVPIYELQVDARRGLDIMHAYDKKHKIARKKIARTRQIESSYRQKLVMLLYGTSEGATKGWENRERADPAVPHETKVHGPGKSVQLPGRYDRTKIPENSLAVTSANGYIIVTKSPNEPDYMWVNHIRVADEKQGKGEGTALYMRAMAAAQAKGLKGIMKGRTLGHGVSDAAEAAWASFARKGLTETITVKAQNPETGKDETYETPVLVRAEAKKLSYRDKLVMFTLKGEWDEDLHPRGEGGKFAEVAGGGGKTAAEETPEEKAKTEAETTDKQPDIPKNFKELPQDERDRIADAENTVTDRVKELTTDEPWPASDNMLTNIEDRVNQVADRIHPEGRARINALSGDIATSILETAGDSPEARELIRMATDVLIAQEVEGDERVLGDHGISHIKGDVDMGMEALVAAGLDTPETLLALRFGAAFHDSGYLTPPSRAWNDKDHPRWSQQYFDAKIRPTVEKVYGKEVGALISDVVLTHDQTDMDWKNEPAQAAMRLGDNLALFHEEKVPPLIRYVPDNRAVLERWSTGQIDGAAARAEMKANIDKAPLPTRLRGQLLQAHEEVTDFLKGSVTGMFSGEVLRIDWDKDKGVPIVNLLNKGNDALQDRLDLGQKQFDKFAKTYGKTPADFKGQETVEFEVDGRPTMVVKVLGKKLLKKDREVALLLAQARENLLVSLYGTTEGAVKGWENRERAAPSVPRTESGTLTDKSGEPLTLYHGSTSRDIEATDLDPTKPQVRPRPGQLNGIYFTSDPKSAAGYTRPRGASIKVKAGRVLSAHLTMKNPLDITPLIADGQKKGLSFGDAKREALKSVTPDHDGTVFRGDDANPDEYLVFSPKQIQPAKKKDLSGTSEGAIKGWENRERADEPDETDKDAPTVSAKDVKAKLTPALATAAQAVYDDWDESDVDCYAGGGICHIIADKMVEKLSDEGIEATTVSAQIGEQHVYVVAKLKDGVYSIDVPPSTYETGGGYSWKKIKDAQITKDDVVVDRIDSDPNKFEDYIDMSMDLYGTSEGAVKGWENRERADKKESKSDSHASKQESGGAWTAGGEASSKEARLPRTMSEPLSKQMGPVDVEFKKPLALSQAQRRMVAARMADRETEMDMALDAEGRILTLRSSGQGHSTAVAMHPDKAEGLHNHPNGAVVQSWADFEMTAYHPVTTVARHAGGVDLMRVERTDLGKSTSNEAMRKVFDAGHETAMVIVREEWASGKDTPSSEAVVRSYDAGWQAMADQGFVKITRERL